MSALVSRVEGGEEIAITRRGVPVARLVPCHSATASQDPREQVAAALARLRQLRDGIVLEGEIKALAREGLDG